MNDEKVEQPRHCLPMVSITRNLIWGGKTIRVFGSSDDPWFHGGDVASALGYTLTRKALSDHIKNQNKIIGSDLATRSKIERLDRYEKQAIFINEAGLYSLIMKSKLKEAEAFQDWVTGEVLPSIRKTGTYRMSEQLQTLQSELDSQRLLVDQTARIAEEAAKRVEAEQKKVEDLRVQAEIERLEMIRVHEAEQKAKDDQLAIQREALRLKHDMCKKWEEKAINREPPVKEQMMYIASTTQYMKDNLWKVGGVECESALSGRLNLYNSGHVENDPFFYVWRARCYNFRIVEQMFWMINEQFRDKPGTKKEMIRMKRDDILRDLDRIMVRIDSTVNECVAEYPETMRRAIEDEGPSYPNLDEPKVKKAAKINIAVTAELSTAKVELERYIAGKYPNYAFDTDKHTTAIMVEWKFLAPQFDLYSNTRTHWCKLIKSLLHGSKITFISRSAVAGATA